LWLPVARQNALQPSARTGRPSLPCGRTRPSLSAMRRVRHAWAAGAWGLLSLILASWAAAPAPPTPGDACGGRDPALSNDIRCTWSDSPPSVTAAVGPQCCCAVRALVVHKSHRPLPRGVYCLPSLVVVGAQKSGTTALAAMLAAHPQVLMAPGKETHYFDHRAHSQPLSGLLARLPAVPPLGTDGGAGWPRGDTASAITAEATPSYLSWRAAVPGLLLVSPLARLVAVLREPGARLYSEWHMKARRVAAQDRALEPATLAGLSRGVECCAVWVAAQETGRARGAPAARGSGAGYEEGAMTGELCEQQLGAAVPAPLRDTGAECVGAVLRGVPGGSWLVRPGSSAHASTVERVGECVEAAADAIAGLTDAAAGEWTIRAGRLAGGAARGAAGPGRAAASIAVAGAELPTSGHRCLGTDMVKLESQLPLREGIALGGAQAARCLVKCDPDKAPSAPGAGREDVGAAFAAFAAWRSAEGAGLRWRRRLALLGRRAAALGLSGAAPHEQGLESLVGTDGDGKPLPHGSALVRAARAAEAAARSLAKPRAGSLAPASGPGLSPAAPDDVMRFLAPEGVSPERAAEAAHRAWSSEDAFAESGGGLSWAWDAATAASLAGRLVGNTTDVLRGEPKLLDAATIGRGVSQLLREGAATAAALAAGAAGAATDVIGVPGGGTPLNTDARICVSSRAWRGALDAVGAIDAASSDVRAALLRGGNASLALAWGGRPDCWPHGTGMNIAVDALARSLYAEQVCHVKRAAAPGTLTVIRQTELREAPGKVLARVLASVGLRPSTAPAETAPQAGDAAPFGVRFQRTGWSVDGGYPPMPHDVRRSLDAFFEPFEQGVEAAMVSEQACT